MSKSGNVVEVRLVKNPAGKSKGFAYVEFEMENAARYQWLKLFFVVTDEGAKWTKIAMNWELDDLLKWPMGYTM